MKAFKGLPKESKLFRDHCENYQIVHNRQYCQKALKTLILTGSKKIVTQKHGAEAFECFTQNDLKSFLKK